MRFTVFLFLALVVGGSGTLSKTSKKKHKSRKVSSCSDGARARDHVLGMLGRRHSNIGK
jgi:hypothetical protein